MRRNAPISALLALFCLSLLAPGAFARTRRHHASPRKATHKRRHHHPRTVESSAPDPATLNRIHTWLKHHPAPTPPVQATSDDFVAAAEGKLLPSSPTESSNLKSESADAPSAFPSPVSRSSTPPPSLPIPEDDSQDSIPPRILPALYNQQGRLVIPRALRGSREILLHQNQVATADGLDRIQDEDDLNEMRRRKMLVALPVDHGLQIDDRLSVDRRYCRPWTAQFLVALSRAHYARFHTALQINSAVRTVAFQLRLKRTNRNAAPAEGDTASPHLTGQTVDLAKKGLSLTEIAWMRGYLLPLVQEGKVDVEEEFQQACFHISVYRKYPPTEPAQHFASVRHTAAAALAAAIH